MGEMGLPAVNGRISSNDVGVDALFWEKSLIIFRLRAFLANGIVERAHNGVAIGNEIWDYLYDPF